MRLELYDEIALLFHSEEKDIFLVQHMIKNIFCVKKIIRNQQDLRVYDTLRHHPHAQLANVLDFAYSHDKTIVIEEFINGCTLDYQISQRKLYPKEVESIILQLFAVVGHIHTLTPSIIHRDIKPENILIYGGHITLIDFEIAKVYDPKATDKWKIGSVGYAAPEQYQGISRQQSDVYALGKLLKVMVEYSENKEQITRLVFDLIEHSTQADISKRYQSVDDMKQDFLKCYHYKKW